uniref:hypothetical protein n=1 Tax=Litorimonas sp. TaxID=1892381 RepID=UPI003A841409
LVIDMIDECVGCRGLKKKFFSPTLGASRMMAGLGQAFGVWEYISMDILGPFSCSVVGGRSATHKMWLLLCVDCTYHSLELRTMYGYAATDVCKALLVHMRDTRAPKKVIVDAGTQLGEVFIAPILAAGAKATGKLEDAQVECLSQGEQSRNYCESHVSTVKRMLRNFFKREDTFPRLLVGDWELLIRTIVDLSNARPVFGMSNHLAEPYAPRMISKPYETCDSEKLLEAALSGDHGLQGVVGDLVEQFTKEMMICIKTSAPSKYGQRVRGEAVPHVGDVCALHNKGAKTWKYAVVKSVMNEGRDVMAKFLRPRFADGTGRVIEERIMAKNLVLLHRPKEEEEMDVENGDEVERVITETVAWRGDECETGQHQCNIGECAQQFESAADWEQHMGEVHGHRRQTDPWYGGEALLHEASQVSPETAAAGDDEDISSVEMKEGV